jgi:hypothetical protein
MFPFCVWRTVLDSFFVIGQREVMIEPVITRDRATEPPAWLDGHALQALIGVRERCFAWGRDALAARDAVQEAVLARWPSLPFTMIAEVVTAVVPDAEGSSFTRVGVAATLSGLVPADRQEVAETLSYALRFNAEGRPRRTGQEFLAPLAAAQLVEQLLRSNLIVMRRVGTSQPIR